METHENIKALREKLGLSQQELAEMTGYRDRSSIAKIEAGAVDLSQSKIAAFAKALQVTPAYLMGFTDNKYVHYETILVMPPTHETDLIGSIACGKPILAAEVDREKVPVPDWVHCDFALRCKGDSMIDARIYDGDIVYIRAQPDVENGEIAAVIVDDEATLKRVFRSSGRLVLRACNLLYPDMEFEGAALENVRIIGKAVAFTSEIRI